jgi:uncharacterized protein YerC
MSCFRDPKRQKYSPYIYNIKNLEVIFYFLEYIFVILNYRTLQPQWRLQKLKTLRRQYKKINIVK